MLDTEHLEPSTPTSPIVFDRISHLPQIIWAMLFHLARFSVFMLLLMAGFALAFYSLYAECDGDLGTAFSTPGVALLSMFKAMLCLLYTSDAADE